MEKSLPLQQEKRLQDRLAGNRQTLGQLVLNQPLSGFQPAGTNVVEDRGIDALHEWRLNDEALHGYGIPYTEKSGKRIVQRAEWWTWISEIVANCYKRPTLEIQITEGAGMDEDRFNMSIRKFLKAVGVTSQREIETAVRTAVKAGKLKGDEKLKATVTLTLSGVALKHQIDGEIELG